jgi:hypothetical protein
MDAELNARLEAEFFEAVKGEGEPLKFSPEEMKASDEWCYRFCGKVGAMERIIRRERALAAAKPDLILN